jgi:deferrochelatase/peroxidase EfeB
MLRRGYTFADGNDDLGRMDAGLFFLAYVRDPHRQYVPMQARLATDDALSGYLTHTRSGLWAIPPGARPGGWVGETLLA